MFHLDLEGTGNSLPSPSFHRRREGESTGINKARKQGKKARVAITRSRLFRRCAGSCERQFKACLGVEGKRERGKAGGREEEIRGFDWEGKCREGKRERLKEKRREWGRGRAHGTRENIMRN